MSDYQRTYDEDGRKRLAEQVTMRSNNWFRWQTVNSGNYIYGGSDKAPRRTNDRKQRRSQKLHIRKRPAEQVAIAPGVHQALINSVHAYFSSTKEQLQPFTRDTGVVAVEAERQA
jgi:hypothetical protein